MLLRRSHSEYCTTFLALMLRSSQIVFCCANVAHLHSKELESHFKIQQVMTHLLALRCVVKTIFSEKQNCSYAPLAFYHRYGLNCSQCVKHNPNYNSSNNAQVEASYNSIILTSNRKPVIFLRSFMNISIEISSP